MLFIELMVEMKRPFDFWKGMICAQVSLVPFSAVRVAVTTPNCITASHCHNLHVIRNLCLCVSRSIRHQPRKPGHIQIRTSDSRKCSYFDFGVNCGCSLREHRNQG